jgi:hypothetical protein
MNQRHVNPPVVTPFDWREVASVSPVAGCEGVRAFIPVHGSTAQLALSASLGPEKSERAA